ncbi:hypothetical protein Scep_020976 [Stephania cephalantha]|uniref:J domain-containing protein n=1 Tax=Stephania cephalantha TaxID=152367 RepID=A0AAP0F847_9MAGN
MECNKDEATRAKEIAERKFNAKDISGAKKFALKAQNLYPTLEGISQLLATLDVYASAENIIVGEADWYGILGVSPSADDDAIRKQFRKLALILHPDKNNSVGADGAFKLISEAWNLLSDKSQRLTYDQKRFPRPPQPKAPSPTTTGSSVPNGYNGSYTFTNNVVPSSGKSHKASPRAASTPPGASRISKTTFWTSCHHCKMQYEYLRVYLNHKLLCPNCSGSFFAIEMGGLAPNSSRSSTSWSSQQSQNLKQHVGDKKTHAPGQNMNTGPNVGSAGVAGNDPYNQTNFQWAPSSTTGGVGGVNSSAASAAQAANQQVYQKRKREQEGMMKQSAFMKTSSGLPDAFANTGPNNSSKKTRVDDIRRHDYGVSVANQVGAGNSDTGFRQGSFETQRADDLLFSHKRNSVRELSQLETRNILMEKAKIEIRKQLNKLNAGSKAKMAEKGNKKQNEKDTAGANNGTRDQPKLNVPDGVKKEIAAKKSSSNTPADGSDSAHEPMNIDVPDPDFHDFDQDRTERSFGANQVWAAYDDDDGMPRYYAMIHNVISWNPFKMRISWLNSKTNTELGPIDWIGSGFLKTCGEFRIGKHENNRKLNSFSHQVSWSKGTRGVIRIYPKKGDVWALYRNWSPDWDQNTSDEVMHKYDMVEVLDDYSEDQGVSVTPLVKVAGFKTVFHQHLDPAAVKKIPREEMFRLSHQVPSYLFMGHEAQNVPKGCRELDPAATPLELLQVIANTNEEGMLQTGNRALTAETKDEKVADNEEK